MVEFEFKFILFRAQAPILVRLTFWARVPIRFRFRFVLAVITRFISFIIFLNTYYLYIAFLL